MKNYFLFLFTIFLLGLGGCESMSDGSSSTSGNPIPWNKPASWEGTGALGGMGFQGTH